MKQSLLFQLPIVGLVLMGAVWFAGCEQSPATKNPPVVAPEPKTPVTAEDVQRETSEAAETTKEYLAEKKDEFSAEMSKKIADLDAKMADMGVEGEKLQGKAKVKWDAAMEDLKVKRTEMNEKLDELKKSSGAAWEDLKAGLQKAGDEIDAAAKDATEKFKASTSKDEPAETVTP